MFKLAFSWSSAQNITCTPHVPILIVGRPCSCGDWCKQRPFRKSLWRKQLNVLHLGRGRYLWIDSVATTRDNFPRSLMTFCHSQTTQPSWSACTVRYSKSGSRTEASLISAGKRQSLKDWGLNESCAVSTISESGHIEKCVGKTQRGSKQFSHPQWT